MEPGTTRQERRDSRPACEQRCGSPIALAHGSWCAWVNALGTLVWALAARARQTAERDLARVLPSLDAARSARHCFQRAGENLAVCLLLRRPELPARELVSIDAEAEALLRDVLSRGMGCVFVSAHIGPFEAVAAAVAELGAHPAVVVRESYDAQLDPLVDAHRRGRGIEVIHRGHPGAAARLLRALRRGRPVGVLPDLGGRVPSAPAELCGQPVSWPVGPQRIALRAGAPVLVGTLAPEGTRAGLPHFRLTLMEVSAPDEPNLTRRVTEELSAAICRAPEHWPWMSGRLSGRLNDNGSLHKNP